MKIEDPIKSNKKYEDYKDGDLRHFYEIGTSWVLSLKEALAKREILKNKPDTNPADLDIYYIEQICVKKGTNISFQEKDNVLISNQYLSTIA